MIRIRQINVNLDNDTLENVYKKAANRLRIKQEEILDLKIMLTTPPLIFMLISNILLQKIALLID